MPPQVSIEMTYLDFESAHWAVRMFLDPTFSRQVSAGAWPTAGGAAAAPGHSDRIRPGKQTHSALSDPDLQSPPQITPIKTGPIRLVGINSELF